VNYGDVLFEAIERKMRLRTEDPLRAMPPVELKGEAELCLAMLAALLDWGRPIAGSDNSHRIAQLAAETVEGLTAGASWSLSLQKAIAGTEPGVGLRRLLSPLRELERAAEARAGEWAKIADAEDARQWLDSHSGPN
jgi:hypothetical protein